MLVITACHYLGSPLPILLPTCISSVLGGTLDRWERIIMGHWRQSARFQYVAMPGLVSNKQRGKYLPRWNKVRKNIVKITAIALSYRCLNPFFNRKLFAQCRSVTPKDGDSSLRLEYGSNKSMGINTRCGECSECKLSCSYWVSLGDLFQNPNTIGRIRKLFLI